MQLASDGGSGTHPSTMKHTLKRLLHETDAQDLAEYGIALALVAGVVGVAAVAVGKGTTVLWTRSLQALVVALLG